MTRREILNNCSVLNDTKLKLKMKPSSNNSGETTPKSSLSKSLKKSSKSRVRISKSAAQTSAPASTSQETPTTSNTPDSFKDKAYHRNYAGFGSRSIKMIWEQHDTSDTEVSADVYVRLAEDATYKVWKLVNCIKTYGRHSGGKVTYDLVNEVLKDSDVPPILGAGDSDWDKIEYDGNFFFNSDKILLLRDEYLSEVQSSRTVLPDIVSSWAIDRRFEKNLFEFGSFLCNALFLGDEESYKYAIDTAAFSPHVGCSLNLLLKKAIEIIAFEQKPEAMDRCLAFLRAISVNPHTRDADCREQLFHLSEILICLLLGTYESISFEVVEELLESADQEVKIEVETLNQMDCEELLQMIQQDGYEERDPNAVVDIKVEPAPIEEKKMDIKQEIEKPVIKQEPEEEEEEEEDADTSVDTEFSPYSTEMCDFKQVDNICATIGCLGSQFGYLQNECTFLIQRRLEKFFEFRGYPAPKDYEYISRTARGLISLGEYAFREIIPFLDKINPQEMPDWIENDFAPAAAFLHGREDIFLYEWLEDLCGYKLQPFMLHFYNYTLKLDKRLHKRKREISYSIKAKVTVQTLKTVFPKPILRDEDHHEEIPLKKQKINIKIAGIRPVIPKVTMSRNDRTFAMQLPSFSYAAVIGKRKLFKPLSDTRKFVHVSNYCFLQI